MGPHSRLHVQVPASTSNLGPGFDFLGLAFGLFLDADATLHPSRDRGQHRISYEAAASGSAPAWAQDDDLFLRSLGELGERTGTPLRALDVTVRSEIPVGRGFGSSGAAVAAALLLGNGVAESPLERQRLIDLAVSLEGHPDNAVASLLGGCTAAVPTGRNQPDASAGGLSIVQPPVHEDLELAIAWPETPLFTPEARAALPKHVPFADAVENPRRIVLLLEGLRRADPELLRLGVADRLHERFRRALIPGADAAIEAAYSAGALAACLSGAGSGLVALCSQGAAEAAANAMAGELDGGQGRRVAIHREASSVQAAS